MRESGRHQDGAGTMLDWSAEIADLESRVAFAKAQLIARLVRRELQGEDPSLIDQSTSKLGRNTHILAAKRRIQEAAEQGRDRGAYKKGRRYLLTQEAHAEEMGLRFGPGVAKSEPELAPEDDAESQLVERLRARRGGRR